jgi:hypothetical protein
MIGSAVTIGLLGTSLTLPLVNALLRRLFPAPPTLPTERTIQELRTEFAPLLKWYSRTYVVWTTVAFAGWWVAFWDLGFFVARGLPPAKFQFIPSPLTWCIPALTMGIVTGWIPTRLALQRRLGDRYPDFRRFLVLTSGVNDRRLNPILMPLVVALFAIVPVGLFANWYVYFTESEIVVKDLFHRETRPLRGRCFDHHGAQGRRARR